MGSLIWSGTRNGGLRKPVVTNVVVTNEDSEWWPGGASRDQRSRYQRGLGVVAWERASRDQRGRDQRELGVVAHEVMAWESQP